MITIDDLIRAKESLDKQKPKKTLFGVYAEDSRTYGQGRTSSKRWEWYLLGIWYRN